MAETSPERVSGDATAQLVVLGGVKLRSACRAAAEVFYELSMAGTVGACLFAAGALMWIIAIFAGQFSLLFDIYTVALCTPGSLLVGVERIIRAGRVPLPQAEEATEHTPPEARP